MRCEPQSHPEAALLRLVEAQVERRLGIGQAPQRRSPSGFNKFGFYFRFGAKDWFGKAEAGGRCTTMKPRFDPWWQLLQAAVSLS
jgi:hypothetical protein